MTGIGAGHNKYDTCQGCPDRCVEPNCHTTCRGYIYRQMERAKQNKERRKNFNYYEYREDAIQKSGKKIGEK